MNRALARLAALPVVLALGACTLLVSTSDLAGGAASDAAVVDVVSDAAVVDASVAASSCRAIRDRAGDAGTGTYTLTSEGGAVQAYCDMESFGGGWTLVTPAMIVEDRVSQDYDPASPGRVGVVRSTDARGGAAYDLTVTKGNCGTNSTTSSPGHYLLVGELDGWSQIMATYEFLKSASCWNLFGDPDGRSTNIKPFDPARDLIGPETNMARTAAGDPAPFDGQTTTCTADRTNFWALPYAQQTKRARVALRRNEQGKAAGVSVTADCGEEEISWRLSDIYVR